MPQRGAIVAALAVVALAAAGMVAILIPRWHGPSPPAVASPAPAAVATGERKITATLYFVSEDGMSLEAIQREVPFGEAIVEQARRIVEAEIASAPAPFVSPVPAGTTLLTLFISERGDAFVDLSGDVRAKHPGGSLDELFTVYAIVDALTVNLPAVTHVQILIDGKEVDTLAGHVDLRHPLQKSLKWVKVKE